MNLIDFIIGLILVNTLPHLVLGIWKGRMLSAFGFSDNANIAYAILNFGISAGLFLYNYGIDGLLNNSMYLGACFVIVAYFFVGKLCYKYFHLKFYGKK